MKASRLPISSLSSWRETLWPLLLLNAGILLIYLQSIHFDFVAFDDHVRTHAQLQAGLTWEGVKWAFQVSYPFYVPLLWISYMVDITLFGFQAGAFLAVNMVLHGLNAALLYLLLWRLFRARWWAFLAVALYALHPMRVESVAWIAQRTELLSTLFALWALHLYLGWVQGRRKAGQGGASEMAPLGMALLFLLSILAKPTWVTLPFVLLLLDWGGLGRMQKPGAFGALVWEKRFLFLLTLFGVALTLHNSVGHTDATSDGLFGFWRLANLVIFYGHFLKQFVWPQGLALLYPVSSAPLGLTLALLYGGLVMGVTLWGFVWARRCPALLTGWLWYLGTMIVMPGMLLAPNFLDFHDRSTYLPHMGVALALTGCGPYLSASWSRSMRRGVGVLLVGALLALALRSHQQVGHWRDTESIWRHAVTVTHDNDRAHWFLSRHYADTQQYEGAYRHALAAFRIKPDRPRYLQQAAGALEALNRPQEAEVLYRQLLTVTDDPGVFPLLVLQGWRFLDGGKDALAVQFFHGALNTREARRQPDYFKVYLLMAMGHARLGERDQAFKIVRYYLLVDPAVRREHCQTAQVLMGRYLTRHRDIRASLQEMLQRHCNQPMAEQGASPHSNAQR